MLNFDPYWTLTPPLSPWKRVGVCADEMVEADPSLQLSLSCCFELGRAIRSGDADTFCEIYDSLLRSEDMDDSGNFQFKVY